MNISLKFNKLNLIHKFNLYTANNTSFKEKICEGCKLKQIDSKLICGVCTTIHTPLEILKKSNYFEIFNLHQKFSIDKKFLEKKYKELQKYIHPDKFALGDENTLLEAHNASSIVGNAYFILKDDFKRANYLLFLKGYESIEEGNATIKDQIYLETFMDIQEQIEEAQTKEEFMEIKKCLDEKIFFLTNELNKNFESEDLEKALEVLKTIKFNMSLSEQINNLI